MTRIKQFLKNDMTETLFAFAFVLVGLMLATVFLTYP
jgi:hypothetical protein